MTWRLAKVSLQAYTFFSIASLALAQNDFVERGVRTFSDLCLMPEPQLEKIYKLATERELKLIAGSAKEDAASKVLEWEITSSGSARIRFSVTGDYSSQQHSLICQITFFDYQDAGRRIEGRFLDEMRGRPNAKPTISRSESERTQHKYVEGSSSYSFFAGPSSNPQHTPIVAMSLIARQAPPASRPQTPKFATSELTYKTFIETCVTPFPDVERIAERVKALGWQSEGVRRDGSTMTLDAMTLDPFNVMQGYGIEVHRTRWGADCGLGFDGRAAIPMERLIQQYGLQSLPELDPNPNPSGFKSDTYSAVVNGTKILVQLTTNSDGKSGKIMITDDTRR
jgi:hypothetical protein